VAFIVADMPGPRVPAFFVKESCGGETGVQVAPVGQVERTMLVGSVSVTVTLPTLRPLGVLVMASNALLVVQGDSWLLLGLVA
jgi:hypothetical protein